MIPVAKPYIGKLDKKMLFKEVNDGWISSRGSKIAEFETKLSKLLKAKYAISCSNGSAALILALKALDIKKNDEVIVPDISFGATINSVINVGAKPIISEIDKETWCLDVNKIEKRITKKTKAILVVHLYGQPANLKKLLLLKKKYNLSIIEDAAESFGATFDGKFTGTIGDVGCFSFFANKTISTGEGGCCVTNNKSIAKKIILLKNHGMSDKKRYYHNIVGYNFRMTNLQAALGIAQLRNYNIFKRKRIFIENFYNKSFMSEKSFVAQKESKFTKKVCWIYTGMFCNTNLKKVREFLAKYKIESRRVFYPYHTMKIYKKYVPKDFNKKNSLMLFNHGLSLPTFYEIQLGELKSVVLHVKKFLKIDEE
jgi:perosamine synthetase